MNNVLQNLLNLFPHKEINFHILSINKNFNMNLLMKYSHKKLAWWYISRWMPLTVSFVKDHPDYKWDYTLLSANSSITLNDILANPDIPWRYDFFSINPNLSLEYVILNMDKGWSWYHISCNPSVKMEDIDKNMALPWNWMGVSQNININIEFLERNSHLPIKWDDCPSTHMKLNVDILKRNINKKWNYLKILNNPHLTIDIVRYIYDNFLAVEYKWMSLTINPAISIKDIDDNLDLPWDVNSISMNPNFTINDAETYILLKNNRKICFESICRKCKDIYEIERLIINNIDSIIRILMSNYPESNEIQYIINQMKQIWDNISMNTNITIKFIKKNIQLLNFNLLVHNNLSFQTKIYNRLSKFYILPKSNKMSNNVVIMLIKKFFLEKK